MYLAPFGSGWGSSPLARGLLGRPRPVRGFARIIPARAGFTTAPGCPSRPARDHPRSRGVYLFHTPDPPSRVWIIPARAGFTQPSHDGPETGPDHPRSRGVYPRRLRGGAPGPGSSPLARGLRGGPVQSVRARGIIPARAGFTGVDVECEAAGEDHPRSRGVYTTIVVDLADERIIPARAGFTRPPLSTSSPRSDHPRSRGVYAAVHTDTMPVTGSSPLARGLRTVTIPPSLVPGIIPARAGFTRYRRGSSHRPGDHPRSRGVYPFRRRTAGRPGGSSPLARGLPVIRLGTPSRPGIIPARAGFTPEG